MKNLPRACGPSFHIARRSHKTPKYPVLVVARESCTLRKMTLLEADSILRRKREMQARTTTGPVHPRKSTTHYTLVSKVFLKKKWKNA